MPDVLCLGLVVADVIGNPLTRLPKPGTLEPCRQISLHPGGCAVNTASALAKLGIPTSLMGAIGQDGFGAYLRNELGTRKLGLLGLVAMPKASTSASIVAVNQAGERSFVHAPGANALLAERHINWKLVQQHRHLHIGASFLLPKLDGLPMARVLKKARALGIRSSLDTVYHPGLDWAKILKPCLPHLDYFLPSYEEARQISGLQDPAAMLQAFQKQGAREIVIKMGAKGCFTREGRVKAPSIKAIDSTGAGDAFCAGFIAGTLKGWPLVQSAKLGNVLGAACCEGVGAYAALPDWAGAMHRMATL